MDARLRGRAQQVRASNTAFRTESTQEHLVRLANGILPRVVLAATFWSVAYPASAHIGSGMGGGFYSGFTHPLFGPDHLLAMVSVGIWGAELGAPAIWVLPIAFPLIMAIGGAAGIIGVPLPGTEIIIACSVIVLGGMVAAAVRLHLALALIIVSVFAFAHGHAHGAEMPVSANALAFSIGFVTATGMLHALGIAIGLLIKWPLGFGAVRAMGSLAALFGVYLIAQHVTATA
jgi:urease accessory protein